MTPRIACLAVPLFPLAARLRSDPELTCEALVILDGHGNAPRVVAATRPARRAGIRPGLSLTQARARLPQLIARRRDAECERTAQEAMLDVAETFSPRIEDAGEGLAYADVAGLERHHDGEKELACGLAFEIEKEAGLPARVAIAASKLTARLLAERSATPSVALPGSEAELLAGLALAELVPGTRTLSTLERWGVRTVGEFAALPRAEVVSRLGPEGRRLQAIARGEDPEPLMPRAVPPVFREGMELEWPLVRLEPFLFVARAALERLVRRMAGHGLGCARLAFSLALEPAGRHQRSITLPSPTRDVKTLLELLRLDLEGQPPGAAIIAFTLAAHPDRPREAQLSLFGPAALSPDRLATTLARLFALLGEGRVGSPRPVDIHRPERFTLLPYAPPPPPNVPAGPRNADPCNGNAPRDDSSLNDTPRHDSALLAVRMLRPPLPLEVVTEDAGRRGLPPEKQRPLEVRSTGGEESEKRPRVEGRVRIASGPWSLEEDWWSEEPVERDYWDVELDRGGIYRLYRRRRDGEWFADGLYD